LYGSAVPEKQRLQYEINYQLLTGDEKKASELADKLLNKYKSDINLYGTVARVFEMRRFFEKGISIYRKARLVAHDENLYTYELANALKQAELYEEAIPEFVKLTRINESYFYASKRSIMDMLKIDSGIITKLGTVVENESDPRIQEIYANALMQVKDYRAALDIYKKLDWNRLLYFANEQFRIGQDSLAVMAYSELLQLSLDPFTTAQVKVSLAKSYINQTKLDDAFVILKEVADDKNLQSDQFKYRCQSNQEAREMLARLALYKGERKDVVLAYLEDARKFAINGRFSNDVEQSIIYHLIQYGDFIIASERLSALLSSTEKGTDTFKESYYYSYLIALNTGDAAADSLLTELIIQIPTSPEVNDALYISNISGKVKGEQFNRFMEAWRLGNLLKLEEASRIYLELFALNPNEEFLIAAADCYEKTGRFEDARAIYEREFTDIVLGEYAKLRLTTLSTMDPDLYKQMIVSFLTKYPGSAFAPEFRRMLSEK
jgi:tetratricopeptide (TPR) repeat protein